MTIEEAYAFVKNEKTNVSKPGLSRIHRLMELLGHPERTLRIIHVVGTNGKGSVSAMLSSVLHAGGYRVGTMSSPALFGLKDYYRIGTEEVPDEAYCRAAETLQTVCGGFSEADYPSEFELSVALGILLFTEAECEYAVLEAGMGGGKDATHLDAPGYLTIVTHIAMDHMLYLGNTKLEILKEKLGIVSKGEALVLSENEKEIRKYCEQFAFDNNSPFLYAGDPSIPVSQESLQAKLSMPGLFQKSNAKTLCAAVYALRMKDVFLTDGAIKEGLQQAKLPFRFQIRKTNPYWIMDGGHNPDCIEALTKTLDAMPDRKKYTIVTGVMADKDYVTMYRMLMPYAARFLCVTPDNPRALPAKDLRKLLRSQGAEAEAYKTLSEAAEEAAEAYRKGCPVLCTGSLYMMTELEKEVRNAGLMI
ncbi:MAG: hypothetical protein J5872_06645 [Lachnospiraceae bacterium]|nr:hypothetical protein [Lachnospiraceae bacterium]